MDPLLRTTQNSDIHGTTNLDVSFHPNTVLLPFPFNHQEPAVPAVKKVPNLIKSMLKFAYLLYEHARYDLEVEIEVRASRARFITRRVCELGG